MHILPIALPPTPPHHYAIGVGHLYWCWNLTIAFMWKISQHSVITTEWPSHNKKQTNKRELRYCTFSHKTYSYAYAVSLTHTATEKLKSRMNKVLSIFAATKFNSTHMYRKEKCECVQTLQFAENKFRCTVGLSIFICWFEFPDSYNPITLICDAFGVNIGRLFLAGFYRSLCQDHTTILWSRPNHCTARCWLQLYNGYIWMSSRYSRGVDKQFPL